MNSINNVVLTGNITRDLDVKQITEKFSVGTTSIAVNKSIKDGDSWKTETSYIDLKIRGLLATRIQPSMTKGKPVTIYGQLVQDRWEKDGQKFSRVYVDVSQIVLGGKSSDSPSETSDAPSSESYDNNGFPEDVPF